MRTHLLIIDPQNDFCAPDGALFVPGADADMRRLATLVERLGDALDGVHLTLDSHHRLDIAHPLWWRDAAGEPPPPFTSLTAAQVAEGRWRTARPEDAATSSAYLQDLEAGGRYPHTIWPEHCLLGGWGHNIEGSLAHALHAWEGGLRAVDVVHKGLNPGTEHFSALRAEVPDPEDPGTQLNGALLDRLALADRLLVAGEARSHCVASTVRDLVEHLSAAQRARVVLLTDAMSDVPDPPGTSLFSDRGAAFVADMRAIGVQVATTTDALT